MGQQCKAETFLGFIPCSLQSKTSVLARTPAPPSLCSSCLCLQFSGRPQNYSSSNFGWNWTFSICAWISGGVYRKWCLNVLEGSFALNLIILVGATYYIRLAKGNPFHQLMDDQLAVGHTSVFIAFVTFIGILGFQLVKVTGVAQWLKRRCAAVANSPTDSLPDRLINPGNYEPLLHTQQENISEPTENLVNEEQRSLNYVYTYTYGTNH